MKSLTNMRQDAQKIFSAALEAVNPEKAIRRYCQIEHNRFRIGTNELDLDSFNNIFVIGADAFPQPMTKMLLKESRDC